LTGRSGPGVVDRLRVPYTYCWSPSVIPKPKDWRNTTDISGFYFLDGSTGYQPPAELDAFLRAGEAPIYIGFAASLSDGHRLGIDADNPSPGSLLPSFGSVPVSDPAALSAIIFEAVEQAGVRAVVSVGWSGLGGVDIDPRRVFLLGDTPHDWLFKHVRAVVHHGGEPRTSFPSSFLMLTPKLCSIGAGTTAIGLLNGCPTGATRCSSSRPLQG
jgi:sterol 3beta-glucosyltransferase